MAVIAPMERKYSRWPSPPVVSLCHRHQRRVILARLHRDVGITLASRPSPPRSRNVRAFAQQYPWLLEALFGRACTRSFHYRVHAIGVCAQSLR